MDTSTVALHAAAIGIATEMTVGNRDISVVDSLIEPLADESALALRLLALTGTYMDAAQQCGAHELALAGLRIATLEAWRS